MKPTALWALDTEDDSKGNVKIINFYNGEEHFTFFNLEDTKNFLCELSGRIEIWACNLQYDAANLFYNMPDVCKFTYVGSRLISAQIEETGVYFKDTLNHWKISVEEMGKRIGLPKLDVAGNYINVEYCQRDTEIVWKFVYTMREKYKTIGAKLKTTIGATALDHFCTNTAYQRPKENIFSVEELTFMREGMHGGRTEAFFVKPIEGMIRCYDFNSLYPSVLAENSFPLLNERYFTDEPDLDMEGVFCGEMESPRNLMVPYLPSRIDGVLYFPLGNIKGTWTYFEIRKALEIGYKIKKIEKCLEFTSGLCSPFKEWVIKLYNERLISQADGDELQSDSFKLIMNNLFGKFSQGNEKTSLLPITIPRLKKANAVILEDKYILQNYSGAWPEHTNYIWSMYCLAYARDKLFQKINQIPKTHKFLYCDTDSLFIFGDKVPFKDEKGLGKLKLEGEFEYAYFMGLKNYKLIWTEESYKKKFKREGTKGERTIYKVRGVPRRYAPSFFEEGFVEYRKPYRLREVLRRNSGKKVTVPLIPNYWDQIRKENKKIYDKRKVHANGETEPIRIK